MALRAFALASAASLGTLLVAGCGGGGSKGLASGGGMSAAPSVVVQSRSAVVSADLDSDGLADLAALARDGTGAGLCWRNVGSGVYVPAPSSWTGASALPAIVDDGDTRDDAALTDGFGVHRVDRLGRLPVAYAVLHLGDGAPIDPAEPPVVDTLEPASGSTHALVAIEGSALAARGVTTGVTFGAASATVLYAFPDYVLAIVPDGLPDGALEVKVTRGDATSAPVTFTVTPRAIPVVTSVVPSTVAPGTVAILRGDHLGTPLDRVEVAFSGAAPVRALGLVRAAATLVPDGAVSGPATITVDGVVSAPFDVVVGAPPPPVVTALSPASASVGSLVHIAGTDLFAASELPSITFAGTPAAMFGLDAGGLIAIVPPGAKDGDVVVTVGGRASAGLPFVVAARGAPRLDSVDPASASVGDVIDVKGVDLVDLSAWRPGRLPPTPLLGDFHVTVGGKTALFALPTPDGLKFVVPAGAVSGDLVVSVHGVASNPLGFGVQ